MQFCKVISYKVIVFKVIYDTLPFLCVETPLQYHLDCKLSLKGQKLEYSARMRENMDQNNPKYRHLSRSAYY